MMRGAPRYQRVGDWRVRETWAEGLPLEQKATPAKPVLEERREMRLEHARRMLARWERKAKTAAGRMRRWRGRVRDVERLRVAVESVAQGLAPAESVASCLPVTFS